MAAATRRLIQRVSTTRLSTAGARRSYGGLPESNSKAPSSSSSQRLMELESKFSAHNYHPVPVVFSRGNGSTIWDPEGKKYIDFLAAYSAVNQGHCHPKIIKALQEQVEKLTLSSRAFYNDKFPVFAERLTNMFGYEMKMGCDNDATRGFGPLLPGNLKVDFGDADSLEKIFKEKGDKIAGFLFEPIQGEAGVVIPPEGYLKAVRDLCTKHNVLMIADEVQSGLARSGKMLACDWEEIRPDMVILGKALGGGVIPVSAVLADKDVMLHIKPGQHGSTFGGNPLASAVAMASLDVIEEEKLVERSASLGEELRIQLNEIKKQFPDHIKEVRGRGLFNAVEFDSESLSPVSAYDICLSLKERGVLAKPTHNTIVRLTPPLSISSDELREGSKALRDVLEVDLPNLQKINAGKTPVSHLTECDRCGRSLYA
ncbi:BnaA06g36140D [Brassica napus]|uniref:Ornithine aminotransferase n=1 Tax=Brassica napus TaxID=3708 RepID=A0A078H7I9_BRANA|nr:BnaA06g36140D [Brassica napus]